MDMLIGLIGKPSVGKSTFFKSATLADVAIASYPFTTIKPNHGIGYVRVPCIDKEFNTQCMPRTGFCKNHIRFVPVELMDVAGLVEGASQGKGLGNQFLDDLRQADAFLQIVDISGTTDAEGKEGKGNPIEDVRMLENELDLWYLGILNKVWRTFSRQLKQTKENFAKAVAKQFSGLRVGEEDVRDALIKLKYDPEKASEWSEVELKNFARQLRILTKPMLIVANKADKSGAKENLEVLKKEFPEMTIMPCSADSELALREAAKFGLIDYTQGDKDFKISEKVNEKQKQALESIRKNVLSIFGTTGVQDILENAVFVLLKHIAVFPAGANKLADSKGNILPDCFLVPQGTTALDFAFKLHTDLGNNFIKAINARTKQTIGKDYVLKNRDGIEIVT
jgi:ribosome-binding ATPase YchF (GTP1/OBG family)